MSHYRKSSSSRKTILFGEEARPIENSSSQRVSRIADACTCEMFKVYKPKQHFIFLI